MMKGISVSKWLSVWFCLISYLQTSTALFAQTQALSELIEPLIAKHQGSVCVAIKHLETGEIYLYREKEVVPTASLIKFPILIEYYRQLKEGRIPVDKKVSLKDEDKVPGSGVLTDHFLAGASLPLETIAHLMITYSDNTATNLILDQVGIDSVNELMSQLGLPETQIHSKVFRRDTSVAVQRSQKYGLGSTTAVDMLSLLEKLHAKQLVSPEYSERILSHLLSCDDKTKLMRFLPKEVKGYHKTGAVNESRTDAGLFQTPSGWIAMVCLTSQNQDKSWGDENAAEILCGRIAETAYAHFHPVPMDDVRPQTLKVGSNGPLVEALQAALNDRLQPSPKLSVDGDFGGMTEQAVVRFRRENGLSESSTVDELMWSKLGDISFDRSANPIVEEMKPLEQADDVEGVPFVSCKAWVVADALTGRVLGGKRSDEPLDIASTTKMMTMLLIATEVDQDPTLLGQQIRFSKRADETPGSSTTIRAGESVTLRDALFGLMLPSGNDAGVAIAQWYGARHLSSDEKSDPYQVFIQAMNDKAKSIGMEHSRFMNPHGITHPLHKSSCGDLVILARELMKSPLVMEIVQTRRHKAIVRGLEGYSRELIWNNTNELLDREGYFGFKTGTTDAAGACLVSLSKRDGLETIVVVLGASGSAARYADSRNLHRWSWSLPRTPVENE